ncbi:MAG: HIRAN domain-containing protein, partial [Prevotellaceae bacterium]|nr:HIRAN domain-containing protein [Prevotellaceae bacterium]
HFATFDIAGFTYYDGIDVFYDLKIGTELNLKAEPTNPFDPYAVIIYYKTTKLGYIPRGENKAISRFLNLGYTELFEVKINRIAPDEHTEQQVGVIVRIRERKAETNDLMDKCDASEEK